MNEVEKEARVNVLAAARILTQVMPSLRGALALVRMAEADRFEDGGELARAEREITRGVTDLDYALDVLVTKCVGSL